MRGRWNARGSSSAPAGQDKLMHLVHPWEVGGRECGPGLSVHCSRAVIEGNACLSMVAPVSAALAVSATKAVYATPRARETVPRPMNSVPQSGTGSLPNHG